MEEKSDCENCKTWEEEMYWKHFNSMHFYQILPKNFNDHLVLPEKFAAHMTTHVPDKVSLIGPSGTMWEIETQKTDNLLLVGDGWKNFVKTYELEENCLLMFKYKRNSSFEVLIFDQESFCEKESCYFVKKCRHTKSEHENHKKRSVREGSSTEVVEDERGDGSAFVSSKKSKKDVDKEANCAEREENTQNPKSQSSNEGRRRLRKVQSRKYPFTRVLESSIFLAQDGELVERPFAEEKQPSINVATQEPTQISLREMTTHQNGETSPNKDHSDKFKDQVVDLAEKSPGGNDTGQELSPNSGRDWSTPGPEDEEDSSETNHLHKVNSLSGKEPTENGTAKKMSRFLSKGPIVLNFRECSPEADDSHKSIRKRGRAGRPKKLPVSKSSMKQGPRSGNVA